MEEFLHPMQSDPRQDLKEKTSEELITVIWWNPFMSKKPKTKDYTSDVACAIGNKMKVFLGTNVWTVRYIL